VHPSDEISCREFVEMITAYFEDALGPRTLEQVEEHLVMCDWCGAYVGQMEATIDSLTMLGGDSVKVAPEPKATTLTALATRRRPQR
jgi:predicted anti-sigma-YlaC factor YlaD